MTLRPQNLFFGKIGPKKSKLSVLSENWCSQYLRDVGSESKRRFLKFQPQYPFLGKFGPKKSKMFALSKRLHTWYLEGADFYFNICFLNFELKIHFWPSLRQKSQICPFVLKSVTFVS